jgi:hypothetical protein
MKKMKQVRISLLLVVSVLTLGLASAAFADEGSQPTAPATEGGHHGHHGHAGPLKKAIFEAFKSCKTAGVDHKACAQQLEAYLAAFKPNS